jgi:vanillate O-demethylase monooxygenase subunit
MGIDSPSRSGAADAPQMLPRHCTFDPDDWRILAQSWFPIALSREVTTGPIGATLLDEPLVVYRSGHDVVVAGDICPHRGTPLSLGKGDGDSIACAYHGIRFGAEGRCIKIPASREDRTPNPKLHLRTYPTVERYGLIWTRLREPGPELAGTPLAAVPFMPDWDDPEFQQMVCPWLDVASFAGRQVEGFIDVAHFAFVHPTTIGDPDNPFVDDYFVEPTPAGFEFEYKSEVGNYHIDDERGREGFTWVRHFRVHLPFTAFLTIHYPDDKRVTTINAASPVSARKTRLFITGARNADVGRPIDEVCAFTRSVVLEDKAIVETQRPEHLPLDMALEAHIAADRSSIAYRRALRDMGFSRFFTA